MQYGAGPYSSKIKKLEGDIKEIAKKVNEVSGVKESDTGLAHPSRWDLVSDKQAQQEEQPLQVGCAAPLHSSSSREGLHLASNTCVQGTASRTARTDTAGG